MFYIPLTTCGCEHMFIDRNFDTQSGPIEKQSVVSESRNALSPIDLSEYVAKYITKTIKKNIYIYIFNVACVLKNNEIIQ